MSNLETIPAQDGFKTTLAQSWDGASTEIEVTTSPSYSPTTTPTYIVVNPTKSTLQIAKVTDYNSTTNKLTVDASSLEKGKGIDSTSTTHSVGSTVIISDNYQFWADIQTAINSKLDNDGGNATTTGDFSLDAIGGEIKFKDSLNSTLTLSDIASLSGADKKAEVTTNDTTPGNLDTKIVMGTNITKTVNNPGTNEELQLDVDIATATNTTEGKNRIATDTEATTGTNEIVTINPKQLKDTADTLTSELENQTAYISSATITAGGTITVPEDANKVILGVKAYMISSDIRGEITLDRIGKTSGEFYAGGDGSQNGGAGATWSGNTITFNGRGDTTTAEISGTAYFYKS